MVRPWLRTLVAGPLIVACWACGGSSPSPQGPTPVSPTSTSGNGLASTLVFTESPIDPAAIEFVVPLGNLNPPGHTLPTDHVYLYHRLRNPSAPTYDVKAPAGGIVRDARRGNDDVIRVQVTASQTYYLGHVHLDASIHDGMSVAAGQKVGTTSTLSYGLDIGLEDLAVTRFFVNPARYGEGTIHAESALKYFEEPLRSTLYSKVDRVGGDKDGKIDFDSPGHLAGNWFLEGLPVSESSIFGAGSKQLAFVRDVNDPSAVRVSLGGALGVTGVFAVQSSAPDPSIVTTSTGAMMYRLSISRDRRRRRRSWCNWSPTTD